MFLNTKIMENRILEFIGHYNTAPFLFVGSGFSRRYLGLEDWEGLLKRFATLNNVDYQYYFSSSGGKLPRIASLIAEDLHERWWKLPEYEKSRNRYKEYNTNKYSALKIEISHYLKGKMDIKIQDKILLEELDLCADLLQTMDMARERSDEHATRGQKNSHRRYYNNKLR